MKEYGKMKCAVMMRRMDLSKTLNNLDIP